MVKLKLSRSLEFVELCNISFSIIILEEQPTAQFVFPLELAYGNKTQRTDPVVIQRLLETALMKYQSPSLMLETAGDWRLLETAGDSPNEVLISILDAGDWRLLETALMKHQSPFWM